MPRLSVWLVRCSFVHLLLGFTLGGLILANKGYPFEPRVWNLLPAHQEFLLLGWMVQLAIGVAFWILPRLRSNSPRGNVAWIWCAFGLLNVGIAAVAIQPFTGADWLTLTGRILETTGVLLFVLASWRRIKPLGS